MTTPTVLLLVLVCMWEEHRGESSLIVSLPIPVQISEEALTDVRAGENTVSLVNHGENAEVLMTTHIPLAPGLTEKGKNGLDELVQISTQTAFTLHTTWNVITSKSEAVGNTQSLEAQESMETDPNGDPSHHLKLQTDFHPESRVLPKSISSRGLVSQAGVVGLTLTWERPRSRHRRSWQWNQFFVIEEYRGPEPVLIGRVRPHQNKCSYTVCH